MSEADFSYEAICRRLEEIPSVATFGYRIETLERGRAVIIAPYRSQLDGIFSSFHGGLLATLADSTGGAAVLTVTGPDVVTATTDLHIRFLAPCRTDARATATVIKAGSSLVVVGVEVHDMEGTHVATCQVSYIRLRARRER